MEQAFQNGSHLGIRPEQHGQDHKAVAENLGHGLREFDGRLLLAPKAGGLAQGLLLVGHVEEGDQGGAELCADVALEVRVADDVGGHVADQSVQALEKQPQLIRSIAALSETDVFCKALVFISISFMIFILFPYFSIA